MNHFRHAFICTIPFISRPISQKKKNSGEMKEAIEGARTLEDLESDFDR